VGIKFNFMLLSLSHPTDSDIIKILFEKKNMSDMCNAMIILLIKHKYSALLEFIYKHSLA